MRLEQVEDGRGERENRLRGQWHSINLVLVI
jgi:hypothetical protein